MVRFRPLSIFMYENAECTKSNFNTKAVPDTDVRAIKKRIRKIEKTAEKIRGMAGTISPHSVIVRCDSEQPPQVK